jgi:hypothetical protein
LREHYRAHGTRGHILKFDVRSYYRSIDHVAPEALFDRYFHYDPRVRRLLGRIIDSFEDSPGKGIPLGSQASSWFAIAYLDGLDRLIKERQRLRHYTRYMDDGVAVHEDEAHLRRCLAQMRDCLASERGLELNQKTQIVPIRQGVDYLGSRLYLTDTGKVVRRLRASDKRRMKRRLKRFRHAFRTGKVDADDVMKSVRSYRAHLRHGNAWHLERRLLDHLALSRGTLRERARDREEPLG